MFPGSPFYHSTIRRTVVTFGRLFSNLQIQYINKDNVTERITKVPISYAAKEKWYSRLREDADFLRQFEIDLPRLSFEITGYQYDAERKISASGNYLPIRCGTGGRVYAPVPWNVHFSLFSYTKTQDEALQIMEQILPYFAPSIITTIDVLDSVNVSQDVPIVLEGVNHSDNYEGSLSETRMIIYQYNFHAKIDLYGPVDRNVAIIKRTIVDLNSQQGINSPKFETYNAEVVPFDAEFNDPYRIDESWSSEVYD